MLAAVVVLVLVPIYLFWKKLVPLTLIGGDFIAYILYVINLRNIYVDEHCADLI